MRTSYKNGNSYSYSNSYSCSPSPNNISFGSSAGCGCGIGSTSYGGSLGSTARGPFGSSPKSYLGSPRSAPEALPRGALQAHPASDLRCAGISPRDPSGREFSKVATELCQEFIQELSRTHKTRISDVQGRISNYRAELQRVSTIMQGYLEREQQLQQMLQEVAGKFQEATDLCDDTERSLQEVTSAYQTYQSKRHSTSEPLDDTRQELDRIRQLLATPPLAPPTVEPKLSATPRRSLGGGGGDR
mmetsp:Transcript_35309/g.75234  ORF Transcript_35309/g.75234 Transcript_35309/m.75234 type:complete len:245 (+) Transcript_35309:3-737(+)